MRVGLRTKIAVIKVFVLITPCNRHHHCQDVLQVLRGLLVRPEIAVQTIKASTHEPSPQHLPRQKPLPQAPASHHRGICQDQNLTTSSREPSIAKTKTSHKHVRAITAAIAKTKALTTSTLEPSPQHLSKQKPYRKHPRAITAAVAKTKTMPQAPSSHHRGIYQDQNLTTSTRQPSPQHLSKLNDATSTLEPSLRHLPRQKPYHKHLRAITTAFAKTKTLPQAPASHHRNICQNKNLTTSTREPSPRHLPSHRSVAFWEDFNNQGTMFFHKHRFF